MGIEFNVWDLGHGVQGLRVGSASFRAQDSGSSSILGSTLVLAEKGIEYQFKPEA